MGWKATRIGGNEADIADEVWSVATTFMNRGTAIGFLKTATHPLWKRSYLQLKNRYFYI